MNGFEKPKKGFKFIDSRKFIIIGIFILIGGLLTGGYVIYQTNINKSQKNNDNQSSSIDNSSSSSSIDGQSSSTIIEIKEYKVATWNNKPYKPSKHFFTSNNSEDKKYYEEYLKENVVKYYNVATLTTGETVIRTIYKDIYDDYFSYDGYSTFIIDNNNQITRIKDYYDDSDPDSYSDPYLIPEIKIDKSIYIPEIYPNTDIIYENTTFVAGNPTSADHYSFDNRTISKITSNEFGDLFMSKYAIKGNKDGDMYSLEFYLKTPDNNLVFPYEINPFLFEDEGLTLKANFIDPKNKEIRWIPPFDGCDFDIGEGIFIDNFNPENGIKIASTLDGNKPIYKLTDEKIIRLFFEEYYYEDSERSNEAYEKYKNALTQIVYEALPGRWQILSNIDYTAEAQCAKPVIYFYPEKDTYVDVEVGAKITISEPNYPIGGWKHVFAKTDGSLTYNGKNYESLFWEGLGNGKYPIKGRVGKLVTQDQLIPSIKKDLLDQGFNKKEIADFLEFWQDNLPKSPYVRLTWLNTKEMNDLAPLKIYPRPQTIIRVFLKLRVMTIQ